MNKKLPRITLIAAIAKNKVIGRNEALPWHLPEDLQRFKQLTLHHTIIMGRKTWESIGRPLPERRNIVLARHNLTLDNVEHYPSLQAALDSCTEEEQVFIIGGEKVFKDAMPLSDRMELTCIDNDYSGDVYFPKWHETDWKVIKREKGHSETFPFPFVFLTLERKKSKT